MTKFRPMAYRNSVTGNWLAEVRSDDVRSLPVPGTFRTEREAWDAAHCLARSENAIAFAAMPTRRDS
jgi:hypothetical protein